MSWFSKEQPTPFDNLPIEGLFFLDGDLLTHRIPQPYTKGEKFPMIAFPSGIHCELWVSSDPKGGIVHLFGEMDVSLNDTRDHAYAYAVSIADMLGYRVNKVGTNQIDVHGDDDEHLRLTYDDTFPRLINVEQITPQKAPKTSLLAQASREKLPPLYSQEALGLNAQALVKFFTPDSNWTWYASEASALLKDDTYAALKDLAADDPRIASIQFFGLVSGFEVELGYFTLEELEAIRGPLGLPVELDRWFSPQPLKDLRDQHRKAQGGST